MNKTKPSSFVVVKHNDLIEASYTLGMEEQRVVLCCIAKLDSRKGKAFPKEITASAREYAEVFGVSLRTAYKSLKRGTDNLYHRSILLKNHQDKTKSGEMRWVYRVDYSNGSVALRFSPDIQPYLSQLSGLFSSYQLQYVTHLKSPYSVRLYELLSQWQTTGNRVIEVDAFRDMLVLGERYARYTDLRKWVIEPAVKEVNEKTNFQVEFTAERLGRRVERLDFRFLVKRKVL